MIAGSGHTGLQLVWFQLKILMTLPINLKKNSHRTLIR